MKAGRWPDYLAAYKQLIDTGSRPGFDGLEEAWASLVKVVRDDTRPAPYHIALIVRHIERLRAGRDPASIAVFEHGCGAGHSLIWLAAMGYTDFAGVDVGGNFDQRNRVFHKLFGGDEARLRRYDGQHIELPDNRFDFIYSEQVIEHVADHVFDSYYAEEARLLRAGGLAVHHVPHRLVPYDSHTRTWFIHYLPEGLYKRLGDMLGTPVPSHLHLRWPWIHRRKMKEVFGNCEDTTLERFALIDDLPYYDGPKRMRQMLGSVITAPGVGRIAGSMLRHFIMLETVSRKTAGPAQRVVDHR